jgi:hypothetical protein
MHPASGANRPVNLDGNHARMLLPAIVLSGRTSDDADSLKAVELGYFFWHYAASSLTNAVYK